MPIKTQGAKSGNVPLQDDHSEPIGDAGSYFLRWKYAVEDSGVGVKQNVVSTFRPIVTVQFSQPGYVTEYADDYVLSPIRCDSLDYIDRGSGCIIDPTQKNLPILDLRETLNLPKMPLDSPQFYDHVLNSQNNGSPGNSVQGAKLTRLKTDDPQVTANADSACPTKKTKKYKPAPDSDWQCDEYPFRSTAQGGARKPSGGRTFNFCHFQVQADGTSNPYLPLADASVNYDSLGWTACIIKADQNQAGGKLNRPFYSDNRIAAQVNDPDDGFFVLAYH